jgi:hypothetical protein
LREISVSPYQIHDWQERVDLSPSAYSLLPALEKFRRSPLAKAGQERSFNLLDFHVLARLVGTSVNSILAVMFALGSQPLALRLGQILAQFSTGQSRFQAGVRCDKFSLLGKGGTLKHGYAFLSHERKGRE